MLQIILGEACTEEYLPADVSGCLSRHLTNTLGGILELKIQNGEETLFELTEMLKGSREMAKEIEDYYKKRGYSVSRDNRFPEMLIYEVGRGEEKLVLTAQVKERTRDATIGVCSKKSVLQFLKQNPCLAGNF